MSRIQTCLRGNQSIGPNAIRARLYGQGIYVQVCIVYICYPCAALNECWCSFAITLHFLLIVPFKKLIYKHIDSRSTLDNCIVLFAALE